VGILNFWAVTNQIENERNGKTSGNQITNDEKPTKPIKPCTKQHVAESK